MMCMSEKCRGEGVARCALNALMEAGSLGIN